jgi:hypothetical protein
MNRRFKLFELLASELLLFYLWPLALWHFRTMELLNFLEMGLI